MAITRFAPTCKYDSACLALVYRDGLCRGHWRTANDGSFDDVMDDIDL